MYVKHFLQIQVSARIKSLFKMQEYIQISCKTVLKMIADIYIWKLPSNVT